MALYERTHNEGSVCIYSQTFPFGGALLVPKLGDIPSKCSAQTFVLCRRTLQTLQWFLQPSMETGHSPSFPSNMYLIFGRCFHLLHLRLVRMAYRHNAEHFRTSFCVEFVPTIGERSIFAFFTLGCCIVLLPASSSSLVKLFSSSFVDNCVYIQIHFRF